MQKIDFRDEFLLKQDVLKVSYNYKLSAMRAHARARERKREREIHL